MSYRKQISYLELQENGQRIRSAGYARLESLDKEEILTVQLNGQEIVSGKGIPLYLQWESGEHQLCEMTTDQGRASCEKRIPLEKEREQILGIRIPLERNCAIVGKFEGTGDSKKKSVPKPENVMKSEEPKLIEKKAAHAVDGLVVARIDADREESRGNSGSSHSHGDRKTASTNGKGIRCRYGKHPAYERYQMGAVKQHLPTHSSLPGCQGILVGRTGRLCSSAGTLLSDDP